jgi:DNA polymerase III delta prime subunit
MMVGNVHIVAGSAGDISAVLTYLREENIETAANPDLYVRHYPQFGIGEARELSERAALRPVHSLRRTFVIAVDSMTAEAQNALLKTLEEPRGNALFVFIHPAPQTLLPTVRSRAQMLSIQNVGHRTPYSKPEDFLKATSAKRLEMLKPLLEKDETDKRDLGAILQFLASLEHSLGEQSMDDAGREGLEAVYRARKYIGDRGALVKPLLEQIALLV